MQKIEYAGKTAPQSPPSPPDEPIFTSAHSALMFAFNFSHGTLKKSFMALDRGRAGRGLAGLDGAAQAGMILLEVNQLLAVRRHILEARFLPQSKPCECRSPCCVGLRPLLAWSDAIAWLSEYVLTQGLTGTISHFRLRRAVVARYFGVRESFISMAAVCHVNRDTASDLNKRVTEHLRVEERTGMYDLEGRLKNAGIVAT